MSENYITDIEPTIHEITGHITAIRYKAWASRPGAQAMHHQLAFVLDVPADADGVFTDDELVAICMERPESKNAFAVLNDLVYRQTMPVYKPPVIAPPTEAQQRELWAKQIDATIRLISDQYTCFQMEYVEREAAAIAYQKAGFEGMPDEWITRFADSARIPYPEAAQRILTQAAELRPAIKELGGLRMEKYRVLTAETQGDAQREFTRIIAAARAIEENLP